MKNRFMIGLATAFLIVTLACAVFAQGEGQGRPGGGPGAGPGAGPGGPRGERRQMPENFQLMRVTRQISGLNGDKKHALTAAQAKKVLAILKPLRAKTKLTATEAKAIRAKLNAVFNNAQLDAMANSRGGFGRGGQRPVGGQGGPGGPGRGGPGGPGGQRPDFNSAAMKDFNPFYSKVAKSDERGAERAKRMDQFFAEIEKIAKGK